MEQLSHVDYVTRNASSSQGESQLYIFEDNDANREFQQVKQKSFHTLRIFVFLHGLVIWLVMQRSVWNDIVSWRTKTTQQLYKGSTPCIDDHHFKEEEIKSVEELSHVCCQIVLKCLYLARIGRPDILWSQT